MRHARSQVGSRLAVASSAKISRPRPPPGCTAGIFFRFSRNCSTSTERASVGSWFLPSVIAPSCRAEPYRSIVEHGAAARQTGVGARQQVYPDTLLEGIVGPQAFHDHYPRLQPAKGAGANDDATPPVPDAYSVAIAQPQSRQHVGVHQRGGPALAGYARRRVVKARVEKPARRRRDQPEWLFGITLVDDRDMVRIWGQLRVFGPDRRPICAEMEFPVGMPETVEKMAGLEWRAAIEPAVFRKALDVGQAADLQGPVDQLDRADHKAGVASAEPLGEPADHIVIGPALGVGRQYGATDLQVSVSPGGIDVVMLQEGGSGQYDVGHCRGFGHELLVDADKQVGARETAMHKAGFRGNNHRVGVLDQQCRHRWSVPDVAPVVH